MLDSLVMKLLGNNFQDVDELAFEKLIFDLVIHTIEKFDDDIFLKSDHRFQ